MGARVMSACDAVDGSSSSALSTGGPQMNETMAEGRADLIAFGKPFISNPDLVIRLLLEAPLMPAKSGDLLRRR
jgi:2,4-dienoyl-CoA reductase-like NADH-dependent reductase (Old Yellow Enzyme family)